VRPTSLAAVILAATSPACVGPFGRCDFETIEITMAVTISRAGTSTPATLRNALAPTNLSPDEYARVRGALIDNAAPGAIFTVPAFDTNGGMLALMFRTPLEVGQRLPVTRAFAGGGWGTVDADVRPQEVWISVRDEGFQATAVDGWLEVTAVMPLAFTMDVTVSAREGPEIRLAGTAEFRRNEERRACD
jgi:hypothetical protein